MLRAGWGRQIGKRRRHRHSEDAGHLATRRWCPRRDHGASAGHEHAKQLLNSAIMIRKKKESEDRPRDVERGVRNFEGLAVHDAGPNECIHSLLHGIAAQHIQHSRREVSSQHARPASSGGEREIAGSRRDIEDACAWADRHEASSIFRKRSRDLFGEEVVVRSRSAPCVRAMLER